MCEEKIKICGSYHLLVSSQLMEEIKEKCDEK